MLSQITFQSLLPSLLLGGGVLLAILAVAWILRRAVRRLARRINSDDEKGQEAMHAWIEHSNRLVNRGATVIAVLSIGLILLRGTEIEGMPRVSWESVVGWLSGPGIRIVLVLGIAYALLRTVALVTQRLPALVSRRRGADYEILERRQRIQTITNLLHSAAVIIIGGITALIVLREVGYDVTPILTGIGIGGLALGFGAQNLVRDVISGFFMILENQVAVGDVAVINGKGGLVEAIRLRTIVLRDLDGTVHVFPNGAIESLSNMTHEFSYYVIDITIDYREDVDRVAAILKRVSKELRADPQYSKDILDDLEVAGIDNFTDAGQFMKIRIKTLPMRQWHVGRELRRRIKQAFDAEGVDFPSRAMTIKVQEDEKPISIQLLEAAARHTPEAARHQSR